MVVSQQDKDTGQINSKNYPVCGKCNKRMDNRITRGALVKTLLFWLPLRRYKCNSCGRKRYVMLAR